MALHNFIRDNHLHAREFDRCDADEEYLLQQTMVQTQGDENADGDNEDIMNTIRSRIADVLVSKRGR
jgi:hypothetical protein